MRHVIVLPKSHDWRQSILSPNLNMTLTLKTIKKSDFYFYWYINFTFLSKQDKAHNERMIHSKRKKNKPSDKHNEMNKTVEVQIERAPYKWNHIQYVLLSCWTPRSITMQANSTLVDRNLFTSFTHESRRQALSKFSQCLFCQLISLATSPTTTFPNNANIGRKIKAKENENEKFNVYTTNRFDRQSFWC